MSFEAVVEPEVQSESASAENPGTQHVTKSSLQQPVVQAADESSITDWVTLALLPGCGAGSVKKLIDHFSTPRAVLAATRQQWAQVPGLGARQLEATSSFSDCRRQAEEIIARLSTTGIRILSLGDEAYPMLLREIPDPPTVLYCNGNMNLLHSSCVAMVGSRSATSYGRRVARAFAEELSREGVTVVSGMAFGIDSESHLGALQNRGSTIGVLGCGIDVVYPRQNSPLFEKVRDVGLLISEYPPGVRPEGFRFPARNRIIAGLSSGVVVIEAARKSGSLITAQLGVDFGREIFAVPGQIDSYKSEGAHWLLQQGAQLVMMPGDIIDGISAGYSLGGSVFEKEKECNQKVTDLLAHLEPDAVALFNNLESYPVSREEVSQKIDLSQARLSELFLYLELEGVIEMGPGDMVRRTV